MKYLLYPDRSKEIIKLARCAGASYIPNKDYDDYYKMLGDIYTITGRVNMKYLKDLSSKRISTFVDVNRYCYVIAHRGTALDTDSKNEDLLADIRLAFKTEGTDSNFKWRLNETIRIIKEINKFSKNKKIYLTGHSLGGTTAYYSMVKNEFIFNNIYKCVCFNLGTTPLNMGLVFTRRKDELDNKIELHHIKGDPISMNVVGLHGKKITYYYSRSAVGKIIYFLGGLNPFFRYGYIPYGIATNHGVQNFY